MSCSFMEPAHSIDRVGDRDGNMPCVIYLHGNEGNKLEGMAYAD